MTPDQEPGDAFDVTIRILRKPGMTRAAVLNHMVDSVRQWTTTLVAVTPVTLDPAESALIEDLNRLLGDEDRRG